MGLWVSRNTRAVSDNIDATEQKALDFIPNWKKRKSSAQSGKRTIQWYQMRRSASQNTTGKSRVLSTNLSHTTSSASSASVEAATVKQ